MVNHGKIIESNIIHRYGSLDFIPIPEIRNYFLSLVRDDFMEHYGNMEASLAKIKLKAFVAKDLDILFRVPPALNGERLAYHDNLIGPNGAISQQERLEYSNLLAKLDSPARDLLSASRHFHDPASNLGNVFRENQNIKILEHRDIEIVRDLSQMLFQRLSDTDFDLLLYLSSQFEQYSLVTFEPYLISVLGNALFFKVFVPLHQDGGFSSFIQKAIERERDRRATYYVRIKEFSQSMLIYSRPFHPYLRHYIASGTTTGALLGSFGYAWTVITNTPPYHPAEVESRVARDLASIVLAGGGLNSRELEALKDLVV